MRQIPPSEETRQHAVLAASASHRWLHCTAAPSLEMKEEDTSSQYAEEGTLAHAICEAKLKEFRDPSKSAEQYYAEENGGHKWSEHKLYLPEMEDTSDYYRDVVAMKLARQRLKTYDAKLLIEVRLDFSRWIPQGFGTADAVIIGDGEIDVIDYKHGKGVRVASEQNPQMMIYALGAYDLFNFEYKVNNITMTIVQPRIDNTSTWTLPCSSLLKWGDEVLASKAREAFNGTLGCETNTQVGCWCRFCKVKHSCVARAKEALCLLDKGDPRLLTTDEVAELLPRAENVKDWCNDLETYALGLMLGGSGVDGYKVVEGRSTRKVKDSAGLVNALRGHDFKDDDIFKPRELRSLTDLERLVGKKVFATEYGGFLERPKGKPTIAPASDKRPEYSTISEDFSHIIN